MIFFDSALEPIDLMAEAGGPTKIIFFVSNKSTKSAFSDKKP